MRKAAVVGAAAVVVGSVFALDLRGEEWQALPERAGVPLGGPREGRAPGPSGPRGKRCPPFLSGGPPPSNPWCLPRGEVAAGPPIGFEVAGQASSLRGPEGSTTLSDEPGPEEVLLGITWGQSLLVSFDPDRGQVIEAHTQLNPDMAFAGLAYDRIRHRLYALPEGGAALTVIDADTLQTVDIVSLRVDPRVPGLTDAVALALDPGTGTLYTVVGHWTNYPLGPIWSELATIDLESGELAIVGRIDGPWIVSLAFSETDRQLYGTGVYGAGPWDSPYPTHVLRIDPVSGAFETVFVTPYHTMLGFALREPLTFFSWINWTSHFYGRIDLPARTVTPLGIADDVGVIYAMIHKSFSLPPRAIPIPPEPLSFTFGGIVSDVWDPGSRLEGRVQAGHRFTGQFSYDAAAPFKVPDPNRNPPYGVSLVIDGFKYASTGLSASIANDRYDWIDQRLTDSFSLAALALPKASISWTLVDPTAEALSSNARLPGAFDLSDWESNSFTVYGYDECCSDAVYAFSGEVDRVIRKARRSVALSPRPKPQQGRQLPVR